MCTGSCVQTQNIILLEIENLLDIENLELLEIWWTIGNRVIKNNMEWKKQYGNQMYKKISNKFPLELIL